MDRKSTILFALFFLALAISIGLSYYRFMVVRNFQVITEDSVPVGA